MCLKDSCLNTCPGQITLFKDWVAAWSDDQKSYLILRLKVTNGSETQSIPPLQDIDQAFCKKYEQYLEYGKDSPERVGNFWKFSLSAGV